MGSDFRINLYREEMMVDAYGVVDPKLCVKIDGSLYKMGMILAINLVSMLSF